MFEPPWKNRCCWGQELGCELDPKRVHFQLWLTQCGKFLSSNELQAKQLLNFSLSLLIVCFLKKRLANRVVMKALDGLRCSVGRICVSASTELCQCTFGLADSFPSKPWPLRRRHYQVRKNWDMLLGGFELWILAYRKCYACFLSWPDRVLVLGFLRQKVEQNEMWLIWKGNGEEGPYSHHLPKYALWGEPCRGSSSGCCALQSIRQYVAPVCLGNRIPLVGWTWRPLPSGCCAVPVSTPFTPTPG